MSVLFDRYDAELHRTKVGSILYLRSKYMYRMNYSSFERANTWTMSKCGKGWLYDTVE